MASLRALGARLDAATPADRDRAVDALRALAVAGVVLGHWLVTALVDQGGGRLTSDSPLRYMPGFAPVSWVFQTLAVFFLVGGYAAARSWTSTRGRGDSYGTWLRVRLHRLFAPVGLLLAVWTSGVGALVALGAPSETVRTLITLVLSPLWFLIVFALVTALTPALASRGSRAGNRAALLGLAMVVAVDLAHSAAVGPGWLGWASVLAGWVVPFGIGAAWAGGGWSDRRSSLGLFAGGLVAAATLVTFLGYPVSMVGVPGERVSNLNPPTLAAVTFGLAQCGLALLLRAPLARAMQRPRSWAIVAMLNLSAIIVFLWHQSALLVVTLGARTLGTLPGLHTAPDSPAWVLQRLAWLPLVAVALGLLWAGAGKLQRPSRRAPHTA